MISFGGPTLLNVRVLNIYESSISQGHHTSWISNLPWRVYMKRKWREANPRNLMQGAVSTITKLDVSYKICHWGKATITSYIILVGQYAAKISKLHGELLAFTIRSMIFSMRPVRNRENTDQLKKDRIDINGDKKHVLTLSRGLVQQALTIWRINNV